MIAGVLEVIGLGWLCTIGLIVILMRAGSEHRRPTPTRDEPKG